jgi:hypothetical protein
MKWCFRWSFEFSNQTEFVVSNNVQRYYWYINKLEKLGLKFAVVSKAPKSNFVQLK